MGRATLNHARGIVRCMERVVYFIRTEPASIVAAIVATVSFLSIMGWVHITEVQMESLGLALAALLVVVRGMVTPVAKDDQEDAE